MDIPNPLLIFLAADEGEPFTGNTSFDACGEWGSGVPKRGTGNSISMTPISGKARDHYKFGEFFF